MALTRSYGVRLVDGRWLPTMGPGISGMTIHEARREASRRNAQPLASEPWPDIESGLGIGGIGSDDFNIGTERDSSYAPQYGRYGGQLWQECEMSGCHNEPVCATCFCCEELHCHCR